MNSVYKAQCKTFSVAMRLSANFSQISSIQGAMMPPFCLRIVRQHRTPAMQEFRNQVAKATIEDRKHGN